MPIIYIGIIIGNACYFTDQIITHAFKTTHPTKSEISTLFTIGLGFSLILLDPLTRKMALCLYAAYFFSVTFFLYLCSVSLKKDQPIRLKLLKQFLFCFCFFLFSILFFAFA